MFIRCSEICLNYTFQRSKKRKSGLTFFVGILSLRNSASRHNTFHGACIFTNPIPWILVFKEKSKRFTEKKQKVTEERKLNIFPLVFHKYFRNKLLLLLPPTQ